MSDHAEKLAKRLEREGEKAVRFFSGLPEDIWERTVYSDGASWRVQQVLAHVVETESSLPGLFKHIVDGGNGVPQDFDLNEYNEQAVSLLEQTEPEQLVSMFSERRTQTIGFVRGLMDEDLARKGFHPFLGQAPVSEMIRLFYLHVQIHIRDVRSLMEEKVD
jgi:hypothetical protein